MKCKIYLQRMSCCLTVNLTSYLVCVLQYRVVVSEVFNILKTLEPLIRPAMFIGQSSCNGKGGLPQKKQLEVTYCLGINKVQLVY